MKNILSKTNITIGGKKRVLVEVTSEKEKIVKQQFHHIHVLDRSGSMANSINQLIDNVKETIRATSDNDIFSLIWFSGVGEFRTIIKGAKKSDNLYTLLETLKSTLGATCFSDPINEIEIIVNELKTFCPNISVTFFTDGCPVVPWSYDEEKRKIFASLNNMKNVVTAFNCVGYSWNYDRQLMQDIANTTEYGVFVHSNDVDNYKDIFMHNYDVLNTMVATPIEVKSNDKIIFLTDKFTKMTDKTLKMTKTSGNGNKVFVIDKDDFTFTLNGEIIDTKTITDKISIEDKMSFLYAYASNSYYQGQRQECFDVLTKNIRDKALIDQQMAAFTFDEVSNFQKVILEALYDKNKRFIDGKSKSNYVPSKKAHCVMDVIVKLANTKSYYFPLHAKSEKYERVSRKVVDTENKFVNSKKPVLASFEDFVFASDKLNMSIKFNIKGFVKIDKKVALDAGLNENFQTSIFRTYTIIKDGRLNIKKLVVAMPLTTFTELKKLKTTLTILTMNNDEINALKEVNAEKYVMAIIDLTNLPIINRTYSDKTINMNKIFEVTNSILQKQAYQKWLRYYIKQIEAVIPDTKQVQAFKKFTPLQIEILEQYGIDKSGFYKGINNKIKPLKDAISYTSKNFEFMIKGCKSLPSIKDLEKRIEKRISSGKKLLISQQVMFDAKIELEKFVATTGHNLANFTLGLKLVLEKKLQEIRKELRLERYWLGGVKIAKTLTQDWFDELVDVDNKGNYVFEKDGKVLLTKTNIKTEYK